MRIGAGVRRLDGWLVDWMGGRGSGWVSQESELGRADWMSGWAPLGYPADRRTDLPDGWHADQS